MQALCDLPAYHTLLPNITCCLCIYALSLDCRRSKGKDSTAPKRKQTKVGLYCVEQTDSSLLDIANPNDNLVQSNRILPLPENMFVWTKESNFLLPYDIYLERVLSKVCTAHETDCTP